MNLKSIFSLFLMAILVTPASFALNPSRTYKQLPDKYNMKYQKHTVDTEDGAKLNAWYFSAKTKTTKLILISHNGEGNMGDYLQRVDEFIALGYNVVTYDYRGFGESSEFEIDNNMYIYPHFQDDMKAMLDFCRQQYVQMFDCYGWGIGAGLSLGIGYSRNEIKSIIADTPFLSMEDLEERYSEWDEPMEVPFAGYDKKYEPIYSFDSDPVTLKNTVKKVKLIVGSNDALFESTAYNALRNKQKQVVKSEVFVVENPDRKDNFKVDKTAYMGAISDFLTEE